MTVKEMDILEAAYENHRADVERREADYMRELNTKLAQINAQAKMIKALVDALTTIRRTTLPLQTIVVVDGRETCLHDFIDSTLGKLKEGK